MVHMMNTTRAARPGKDKQSRPQSKSSKQNSQNTDHVKQSHANKNKDMEDSELEIKIKKVNTLIAHLWICSYATTNLFGMGLPIDLKISSSIVTKATNKLV